MPGSRPFRGDDALCEMCLLVAARAAACHNPVLKPDAKRLKGEGSQQTGHQRPAAVRIVRARSSEESDQDIQAPQYDLSAVDHLQAEFVGAILRGVREGIERFADLRDVQIDAFQALQEWLHAQTL